ncbi:OLC1v1014415C1 [Oldenlandia corymbosa var. corymbosa]|uniref:OLC1v1014415C1 n=2 Tax=Oldenlandia corymbosa var. corymbosa TaxID=529605 RepID=A0AAV1E2T4_OLDCO|nr:OLC1v1014415C1 [Oldenlandia corymbosa var. corymbosa]
MGTQSSVAYGASIQVGGMNRFNSKQPAGYIFMCNGRTKPECYQYRVFGLPSGRRDVVERIKPGAKLFLYDFEVKLLYGVYEATTSGSTNLEPDAFGGKFPAQVGFRIFKECLPLPEKSFKNAIKDNYTGVKFKQELDEKQVTDLISLFSPLAASSSTLMSQPMPPAASAQEVLPSDGRYQDSYETARHHTEDKRQLLTSLYPYLYLLQHSVTQQVMQPPPVQQAQTTTAPVQYEYYPTYTNSYHMVDSQLVTVIRGRQTPNVVNLRPGYTCSFILLFCN